MIGTDAHPAIRVAYLNSSYPCVSHTFIEREVRALRDLGVDVRTFSIRPASEEDRIGGLHLAAADETVSMFDSAARLITRALPVLASRPDRFPSLIRRSLELSAPGLLGRTRALAYIAEAARLVAELARQDVRHIHVHMANNGAAVANLACVLDPRLSYSLSIHGSAEFVNAWHHHLKPKAELAVFVRCISQFCRSQVMAWTEPEHWSRFHVIHCGIDTRELRPLPRRESSRLRLLSLGRLVPIKGHDLLLQACRDLSLRNVDWSLEIVGAGPLDAKLRERAQSLGIGDRVRFCGPVSQEQLPAIYERADAIVISSFMEGLPVVAMEAMAQGVVVVATHVAGVPEIIEHGRTGFLVTPGSVDELRTRLLELDARRGEFADLRVAAREKVVTEFDVRLTAAGVKSLLERYTAPSISRSIPPDEPVPIVSVRTAGSGSSVHSRAR